MRRLVAVAAIALLVAGCSSAADDCIAALNERYSYLQVDQTRTDLKEVDGKIEGMAVFRRKGTTDYQIKDVSCPVRNGSVKTASCPGCPKS